MENENSSFGFWKKTAVVILALFVVDVFLAWRLLIRYGDLLFVEGIVVFGAGALAASGVANFRSARATYGTMTGHPEGQKEFVEEHGKQVSSGIKFMIVGAIIIALSIIFTLI